MKRFVSNTYLIGCFITALMLPHLTDPGVSTLSQIGLQALFLIIGFMGYKTFKE